MDGKEVFVMSERSEKAVELFKSGYNCSQAVFAAYADLFGFDEDTALKVSAGLGGGVGRSREVCGTVSAAAMLIGMKYGATDGDDTEGKKLCYYKVQEFIAEFKKVNPSIVCRELLGLSRVKTLSRNPMSVTNTITKNAPAFSLLKTAHWLWKRYCFKEMF